MIKPANWKEFVNGRDIVVWGTGIDAPTTIKELFDSENNNLLDRGGVSFFVSRDWRETPVYMNKNVYSKQILDKSKHFVIISPPMYSCDISKELSQLGFVNDKDFAVYEWADFDGSNQSQLQEVKIVESSFSFKWLIYADEEPISQEARNGNVRIEHNLFQLFTKPGVFLDLGSNIGAFSLPFGALGWQGYAFEASSINAATLRKSIEINKFDIKVINKAVYDITGSINFFQHGPVGIIQNDIINTSYKQIPCICLDDWSNQNDSPNIVNFVKIDIEGSEVAALRGMSRALAKYNFPPIFIESNPWTLFFQNETQKSLLSTANEMGYRPYLLEKNRLLLYDMKFIPLKNIYDFLLIKDLPYNLSITDFNEYIQAEDEEIEAIINALTSLYENETYRDCSMCYVLKDYPKYANNSQVVKLLKLISEKYKNDKIIMKSLNWLL